MRGREPLGARCRPTGVIILTGPTRRRVSVVAVVPAFLLLVAVGCGDAGRPASRAAEAWRPIPGGPLSPRVGAGIVWAGDRLVVWSGSKPSATAGERLTDGAMWVPATGWQELAPPPDADALVPGGFALWTGREVVLGPVASAGAHGRQQSGDGSSVLAYRPDSDSWRRIVPAGAAAGALGDPTGRFSGVASLIGDEILVGRTGGGSGAGRQQGHLIALDPATGASRALDPGPFDASPYPDLSGEVLVTVAGEKLLAAPNWAAEAWLLDPSGSGTWTPASRPPIADLHLHGSVWIEDEALFLANNPPAAYDVARDRWRSLTPPPPDLSWARLDGVDAMRRAGDRILLVEGMYDPAADAWSALPRLPIDEQEVRIGAFVDWTGDAVVVFGGGSYRCSVNAICDIDEGHIDWTQEGWTYRPSTAASTT